MVGECCDEQCSCCRHCQFETVLFGCLRKASRRYVSILYACGLICALLSLPGTNFVWPIYWAEFKGEWVTNPINRETNEPRTGSCNAWWCSSGAQYDVTLWEAELCYNNNQTGCFETEKESLGFPSECDWSGKVTAAFIFFGCTTNVAAFIFSWCVPRSGPDRPQKFRWVCDMHTLEVICGYLCILLYLGGLLFWKMVCFKKLNDILHTEDIDNEFRFTSGFALAALALILTGMAAWFDTFVLTHQDLFPGCKLVARRSVQFDGSGLATSIDKYVKKYQRPPELTSGKKHD